LLKTTSIPRASSELYGSEAAWLVAASSKAAASAGGGEDADVALGRWLGPMLGSTQEGKATRKDGK